MAREEAGTDSPSFRITKSYAQHGGIAKHSHSSQPMPPAPTRRTLVSGSFSDNSGPRMARECDTRVIARASADDDEDKFKALVETTRRDFSDSKEPL